MANNYEIAKPLFDWFDEWASYKTTKIDNNNVHIVDLQMNIFDENYKFDSEVKFRVEQIGEYIFDSFQDHRNDDEYMERFVNKIEKLYIEICNKLNIKVEKYE